MREQIIGIDDELDTAAAASLRRLEHGWVLDLAGKTLEIGALFRNGLKFGLGDRRSGEHGSLQALVDECSRELWAVVDQLETLCDRCGEFDTIVDEGYDAVDSIRLEELTGRVEILFSEIHK